MALGLAESRDVNGVTGTQFLPVSWLFLLLGHHPRLCWPLPSPSTLMLPRLPFKTQVPKLNLIGLVGATCLS